MPTLIGFGPDPEEALPRPRRRRRLTSLLCSLLLLAPAGNAVAARPVVSDSALAAAIAQAPVRPLGVGEIERRVRPALYTLTTFPQHESAFAFARFEGDTLLATTYQNVLRAADPGIGGDGTTPTVVGGVRVDPDYPVHQVILVRHGSVTHRARVIAAELERDVAVLRIGGRHPLLQTECPEGPEPAIGDRTFAFSAGPEAGVTAIRRAEGRIAAFVAPDQIQSSQGMPTHGEGGPLVNVRGRAIGVLARDVGSFNVTRVADAFSMSVDVTAAYELAGVANRCPEEEDDEVAPPAPEPPEGELTNAQLAEAVLPAVFSIESLDSRLAVSCPPSCTITGSAFGIYTDGESTWIATNHHVVAATRYLQRPAVTVRDGTDQYQAEVVATDAAMDVALVRVEASLPVLAPACGPAETLERGDDVVIVGSPGDLITERALRRLIRGLGRFGGTGLPVDFAIWHEWAGYGIPHWSQFGYLEDTMTFGEIRFARERDIRHTAETYSGNSGGPLLNRQGQVLGIHYRRNRAGDRFAINIDRLFGRLAEKAGIVNPCAPGEEDAEATG